LQCLRFSALLRAAGKNISIKLKLKDIALEILSIFVLPSARK
jgi:hypothetical protein